MHSYFNAWWYSIVLLLVVLMQFLFENCLLIDEYMEEGKIGQNILLAKTHRFN